jgi:hypothetical protein
MLHVSHIHFLLFSQIIFSEEYKLWSCEGYADLETLLGIYPSDKWCCCFVTEDEFLSLFCVHVSSCTERVAASKGGTHYPHVT